ncbi:MAG: aminopeptidase P family protein [Hyphomonadaceae bacterium]|nr:aminopeptidase P family protein [Hyphomonadaceae bacterium]
MKEAPRRIGKAERNARLDRLRELMGEAGVDAVLLGPTSSLRYFTGIVWHPSERFTGALVHAGGGIDYICPRFELEKVSELVSIPGEIHTWEEEESPAKLVAKRLPKTAKLGLDDLMQLFFYVALRREFADRRLVDAGPMINVLRRVKSPAELALMKHAKAVTLQVHKRAWECMKSGVKTSEVRRFIDAQHRAAGSDGGNTFCIVSFGEDTCLPHGGEGDRALKSGDVILIDTGCSFDGYNSDITRTYVFGKPSKRVREVWALEKEAQAAAFAAAKIGRPCEVVDAAARDVLLRAGLGPDYRLPGLPHRTGHGIGLDVHEAPNLVRGDKTPLAAGMCFSNEPMVVIPGEFGIRLEDHFYMTKAGPRWFTEPSHSIDEPFAGV